MKDTTLNALPHEKEINEYIKTIEHIKQQSEKSPERQQLFRAEIRKLEQKLEKLKEQTYSKLTPWERVQISRHPGRPHTVDYLDFLCRSSFHELAGDRCFGNDQSLIGGIGEIDGIPVVILGQEKGNSTESRVIRNFGMNQPEGFRKALRLMELAEKFDLPIISLLDTPGASPCIEAEERGQAWAIANNIRHMSRFHVPIIIVVIGEGCSGGALGIGVGDTIGMLEHSYYSVISPEACASILWKEKAMAKNIEAASVLKLNAEDLIRLEIIDQIIPEPLGGAHHDPQQTCQNVKNFIVEQLEILKHIPSDLRREQRYLKFRRMGKYLEAS